MAFYGKLVRGEPCISESSLKLKNYLQNIESNINDMAIVRAATYLGISIRECVRKEGMERYMKLIKKFVKIILAGITAVAVLSVILCFYDLMPLHHNNTKGNTDYVWTSNARWVKLTEGISWGRFDEDGFNNPEVIENPDIIIVGSSHMEATEIFYDQTVCALLSDKLENENSVYNLGISGHDFFKTCQYLPTNLSMYGKPPKIAIIETSTVNLTKGQVEQALNGTVVRTESHDSGVMGTLQKIPFFRTVYHQYTAGLLNVFMPESNFEVCNDDMENGRGNGEIDFSLCSVV